MFNLSGKSILVAGGAGYLGEAICSALAGQGAHVMIADLAADRAAALAERIPATKGKVKAVKLNAADESSVDNAVHCTMEAFGRLDVLVNATYGATGKKTDELTAAEFDRANRLNLTGTFLSARAAADAMRNGGSIILFTSMYGQVAPDPRVYFPPMNPNPVEYGVGKAGVIQMARYLAVQWGPRGIRVNAVSPGPFPNPHIQRDHPDFVQRLAQKVPLGRIGASAEIAGPVVFLAADESSYVNGAVINVDGGWTVW